MRLILPGRGAGAAQGPRPIDWQGIGRGLIAGFSFGRFGVRDLVAGRTYSHGTGKALSRFGEGASVVASTGHVAASAPFSLAAGADFTAVFAVDNVGFNGGNPGVWSSSSGTATFNIFQGSTGRPWIRVAGSDTPLKPLSGFGITAGSACVFGFRVRSGKDAAFASDGLIRHTNTHSVATVAITIANIGYQNTSAESLSGIYTDGLFFARALPDDELCAITRNIGAVYQKSRRLWPVPSGGLSGAISEAASAADAASAALIANAAIAEAMSAADATLAALVAAAALSEAASAADSPSGTITATGAVSESAGATDSVDGGVGALFASISEAASAADALDALLTASVAVSEAASAADAASAALVAGAALTEAVSLADLVAGGAPVSAAIVETISIADAVVASLVSGVVGYGRIIGGRAYDLKPATDARPNRAGGPARPSRTR